MQVAGPKADPLNTPAVSGIEGCGKLHHILQRLALVLGGDYEAAPIGTIAYDKIVYQVFYCSRILPDDRDQHHAVAQAVLAKWTKSIRIAKRQLQHNSGSELHLTSSINSYLFKSAFANSSARSL